MEHFNPRSPCGERLHLRTEQRYHHHFNPRSPCGERLVMSAASWASSMLFQSTLPVRGATGLDTPACNAERISIHAPRAGSDHESMPSADTEGVFQSTLPVRGATWPFPDPCTCAEISIHAPRAGSDLCLRAPQKEIDMISIHAPRAGSDVRTEARHGVGQGISIHAPRAGSDGDRKIRVDVQKHFNPRSPCGERLLKFESLFGFSNNSCMVIRFLAAPSSLL